MNKLKYLYPCISGLLLCLSFSQSKFMWIAFFAFIPLFYSILKFNNTKKSIALQMLIFSIFYYIPLLTWLYELIPAFPMEANQAKVYISIALLLIGPLFSVYYIIPMIFYNSIKTGKIRDCIFLASLFTLPEYLLQITPFLPFPWAKTGVIVSSFTAFIQSASLFGNLFISFLVILINSLLAFTIAHFKKRNLALTALLSANFIFLINTFWGILRMENVKVEQKIPATSVQGNFSGLSKWKSTNLEMFKIYESLTLNNAIPGGIIVWPETAIPLEYNSSPIYREELSRLSQVLDSVIIVGMFFKKDGNEYNSVIAFSPDGKISSPYSKRMLVPFGEMFPYSNFFNKYIPFITESINIQANLTQGTKSIVLTSSIGEIGGIICYESIFPSLAREAAQNGAKIFALPSNDSWFGNSPALYQHHCHAIMRAVENNRYIIRSSSTGISSIIDCNGKVINFSPTHTATSCNGEVSLINKKTLYTKIGDLIILPFLAIYLYSFIKSIYELKHK